MDYLSLPSVLSERAKRRPWDPCQEESMQLKMSLALSMCTWDAHFVWEVSVESLGCEN